MFISGDALHPRFEKIWFDRLAVLKPCAKSMSSLSEQTDLQKICLCFSPNQEHAQALHFCMLVWLCQGTKNRGLGKDHVLA